MNTAIHQRNPWPIAITAYFVLFIAFIVSFVTFAARQPADLVGGDYYDQEIRYQQQIDRLKRTEAVKAGLDVSYDPADQYFRISLPPGHARSLTGAAAHLYRPANGRLDRDLAIERLPDSSLRLNARDLEAGLWKLRFGWSAGTNEYFAEQAVVIPPAGK